MTNSIVFILHGPSDADVAADLAAALSPHIALPMAFVPDSGVRQPAYGPGATCVLLWDKNFAVHTEAIGKCAPPTTTVICRLVGVALPAALSSYSVIDQRATLEATASALRDAVTTKQAKSSDRAAHRRGATSTPAMRQSPVRDAGNNSLLARSAWGLAATIVVASIAAPAIGDRAGASSVGPDLDTANSPNESSDVMTIAAESASIEDRAGASGVADPANSMSEPSDVMTISYAAEAPSTEVLDFIQPPSFPEFEPIEPLPTSILYTEASLQAVHGAILTGVTELMIDPKSGVVVAATAGVVGERKGAAPPLGPTLKAQAVVDEATKPSA